MHSSKPVTNSNNEKVSSMKLSCFYRIVYQWDEDKLLIDVHKWSLLILAFETICDLSVLSSNCLNASMECMLKGVYVEMFFWSNI